MEYGNTKNWASAHGSNSNSHEQKIQGSPGKQRANIGKNISDGALNSVKIVTDVDVKSISVRDSEHSCGMVANENYRDRKQCGPKPKVSSTNTFHASENATGRANIMTEDMSNEYLVQSHIDTVLNSIFSKTFKFSF